MKKINDNYLEEGLGMVILAVKIIKPDMTDEEAKNIIVNLGNYIQLERLSSST